MGTKGGTVGGVAGATVFIDLNGDGIQNANEISDVADSYGYYSLVGSGKQFKGTLIATGGTSIATGAPNTETYLAPAGSKTINSLTTLADAIAKDQGIPAAQAAAQVMQALDLQKINLLKTDPAVIIEKGGSNSAKLKSSISAMEAQEKVTALLKMGGAVLSGASDQSQTEIQSGLLKAIVEKVAAGETIDLQDKSFVAEIIINAAPAAGLTEAQQTQIANIAASAASLITDAAEQISDAFSSVASGGPISTSDLSSALAAVGNLQESIEAATGEIETAIETGDTDALKDITVSVTPGTGGGGSAGGGSTPVTTNVAPTITSGNTGTVAENAATSTVVYTVTATDPDVGQTLTYSLNGTDAGSFNISATSGAVTLKASADYETKNSYSFNVLAADSGTVSLSASKAVTISVTDVADAQTIWLNDLAGTASVPATLDTSTRNVILKVDPAMAGYVSVTGFGIDDALQFSSPASDYVSVSSAGTKVTLVTNASGVVTQVSLLGITSSAAIIYDVASFNALTVGNATFAGEYYSSATGSSLDSLGGTVSSPATFNAGAAANAFTDSAATGNTVRISNFGSDDRLYFTGADAVGVSSAGTDVTLTVNQNGTLSTVTLLGVVTGSQTIYDMASFNALAVGNIFY
jgi:hypothetical protein